MPGNRGPPGEGTTGPEVWKHTNTHTHNLVMWLYICSSAISNQNAVIFTLALVLVTQMTPKLPYGRKLTFFLICCEYGKGTETSAADQTKANRWHMHRRTCIFTSTCIYKHTYCNVKASVTFAFKVF